VTFTTSMDFTLSVERGWYDGSQPHDPNPTMKGVRQDTYNRWRKKHGLPVGQSVRLIARHELDAIYRDYWDDAQCDEWGERTATAVFEHCINAGPVPAIRMLQQAAGVTDDGVAGPKTRAAVASFADAILAERVLWERLEFYRDLAAPKGSRHRQSLLSWVDRVLTLRASWKV
jgi:lysozyme family protein